MRPRASSRRLLRVVPVLAYLLADAPAIGQDAPAFKLGDCVEFDTTNVVDPAARWRKGRITQNDGYFFTIEFEPRGAQEPGTTTVSLASAGKWLRAASGCAAVRPQDAARAGAAAAPATAPPGGSGASAGGCSFNKNYVKVTNGAAASADLFKGVIFEWEYGLNKRFSDFGLTFTNFQMGSPFKNRVYPGIEVRRDVDAAPAGATIYPIKTTMFTCQKDISITIRRDWDIEYTCFRNEVGAWVCANKAPKLMQSTTLPNK